MTENKDKHSDKEKDKQTTEIEVADKEHEKDKAEHDRGRVHAALMNAHSPTPAAAATDTIVPTINVLNCSESEDDSNNSLTENAPQTSNTQTTQHTLGVLSTQNGVDFYSTLCGSEADICKQEILLVDLDTGEVSDFVKRFNHREKDDFGTQRVYKKTSPNCVLTLYLPSREITLAGNTPSVLRGIVYVDPKAIQGYRIYAQLTLTFRYGREDEEVMGLRFCNEAIMSLHQVWPRNEEPARESLSPLQEALVKRLGDGAHPFTLTLTPQAPPSVQLVPAKRYYGAPIGTSYDVRCFIADKTDEKFHRRASVKMGVRVIYRTDVFHHANGPENFAALINSQTNSPPVTAALGSPPAVPLQQDTLPPTANAAGGGGALPICTSAASSEHNINSTSAATNITPEASSTATSTSTSTTTVHTTNSDGQRVVNVKPRKSERGESFPKLRLSPKSFRFSGRFGRSKSEIEKCPNDPFYNYSKSFQEYDSTFGGGPQGAVDKPFLLQDGRVGLRASLDKAWYTHGEDVCVTVNIRNDSRKTVRKVRVCAIQHVDVCMFNNGKFKNVVADSDTNSPGDRIVPPGGHLNTTIVLKPQRGQTKNWIALEDTLQRSTEPEEITGVIAASAIRSPNVLMPMGQLGNACASPAVGIPQPIHYHTSGGASVAGVVTGSNEERNVFAIYVSYYVKVKLTLSGMGGELSLKLPFVLVHVDEVQRAAIAAAALAGALADGKMEKLALHDVPTNRKNGSKLKTHHMSATALMEKDGVAQVQAQTLDRIESAEDELNLHEPIPMSEDDAGAANGNSTNGNGNGTKRRLIRSETLAKDLDEDGEDQIHEATLLAETTHIKVTTTSTSQLNSSRNGARQHKRDDSMLSSSVELEHVHVVQIHTQERNEEIIPEERAEAQQHPKDTNTLQEVATEDAEGNRSDTTDHAENANNV